MENSIDCTSAARRREVCIDGAESSSGELEPGTARSMLSEMRGTPLSDGEAWDQEAKDALVQFQKSEGLPPTGNLDNITVDRLKRRFDQFVETRHATGGDAVNKSPTAAAHGHVMHVVQHAVHTAEKFAENLGHNATLKAEYLRDVKAWAQGLKEAFESGTLTEAEAAYAADKVRAAFTNHAKGEMSPAGKMITKWLESQGLTLEKAIEKAAMARYGKPAAKLTEKELGEVCKNIGERAGVSSKEVGLLGKMAPHAGKALKAAAIAIAIYEVATADDKMRETIKQGAGFLGFWAGAKVGAIGGAALCSPTGPGAGACAIIGGLIGGIAGSMIAEDVADYAYLEIKG